jgi:hypothetical protein
VKGRFAATTWGQHRSILSLFYRWAIDEEYASAEPFTYRSARALFASTGREVKVNLAVRVCRAKKDGAGTDICTRFLFHSTTPVWYEWDERKEPACNLGLVRIFGKVRTKVLSLGVVLLILGYIFNIGILVTIGWILAVIGLVLFVLGAIGRPLAGRRYWY